MAISQWLTTTEGGLHCPQGNFYIDPAQPVERAVLTHAHGDHARSGSSVYYAVSAAVPILRRRLGDDVNIVPVQYGEKLPFSQLNVSLHPAGHVLGSAQVRLENDAGICVVSGDYKRAPDPTCATFEVQRCNAFVTESTFGLPIYRWEPTEAVIADIHSWWMANRASGVASVLTCYALGKAQRVLAELCRFTTETVYVHGAIEPLVEIYRQAGIAMVPTAVVELSRTAARDYRGALILAPPGAIASPWMKRFGAASTGFCSGWMRVRGQRRRRGFDRGFVLSDHADWPALVRTVAESGATEVYATHGQSDSLVRYLRSTGVTAETLEPVHGLEV